MTACGRPIPRACGAPACPNRPTSRSESGLVISLRVLWILTPTGRQAISIAYRQLWNLVDLRGLIGLDVGRPDHLAPLFGFIRDELAELGRRHRHRGVAEVGKPDLHSRISKGGFNFLVEPLDDFGRSVLGCTDPSK